MFQYAFISIQTYPQAKTNLPPSRRNTTDRRRRTVGEVNRMPQDSNEQFQQFFLQLQVAPIGERMDGELIRHSEPPIFGTPSWSIKSP